MKIANPKRNLRCVFVSLVISSFSTSVLAAANYNWQGPYGGVYLGGGFGTNHVSTNVPANSTYITSSTDINSINSAGTWTKNPKKIIVGIQAGHDWARKQMVYGVALDYSTLPLSSSSSTTNTYSGDTNQYTVSTSMRTNWLFTLRGRLGYQTLVHSQPSLLYLTGGMAMAQLKVSNNFSDNASLAGAGSSSVSQNQIGWTAGAGVEIAALKNLSVDLEYLYVKVPSVKTTSNVTNTEAGFGVPAQSLNSSVATSANFHSNVSKIALNYRFDE